MENHNPANYSVEPSSLKWIGVDLDDTIARQIWPTPGIGEPIWENVAKLRAAHDKGYKIMIHTSRTWAMYMSIEKWLNDYDIPFDGIQCGKPLFHRYVDDRAMRPDSPDWTA